MKTIVLNDIKYEIVENYKDGFDESLVKEKCTDYFSDYDYIFGDWSYGKLRLKGFCERKNNNYRNINDIHLLEGYINQYCSYDCRYFLLKKIATKDISQETIMELNELVNVYNNYYETTIELWRLL